MRQISRNGPYFADDIEICEDGKTGKVFVRNRRTKALSSDSFLPTVENIQDVMKQCFVAGQNAKAREILGVLGLPERFST